MSAGRLLVFLFVGAFIATGASWATYRSTYVVHERAGAEWVALTLTDQALARGQQPQNADAAAFISNSVINKALQQLVGATVRRPVSKMADLEFKIEAAQVQPNVGLMGAILDIKLASSQRGISLNMQIESGLSFRGITHRRQSDGKMIATAEFAVSIMRADVVGMFNFLDVPIRNFLSETIITGIVFAADNKLTVAVPINDRLSFNTGFSIDNTVHTPDGSVAIRTSLDGKVLERGFSYSAPLFLQTGMWLSAFSSPNGQASLTSPGLPSSDLIELKSQILSLRQRISSSTRDLEQSSDVVIFLNGNIVANIVDQICELPDNNRTIMARSFRVTDHIVDNDIMRVKLPNADDLKASLLIEQLSAKWVSSSGVALAMDLRMSLRARVHAHVKPVVNMGTTFGLKGEVRKRVAGVLEFADRTFDGHSILLLGVRMPCDTLTADVTTDGRLVMGPVKVDLVKVGIRWTMPVPQSLGQPNLVFDDLPRRFGFEKPKPNGEGITVRLAHKAIEYTTRVTSAKATDIGYAITANLDIRPADTGELPSEVVDQRRMLADSVNTAIRSTSECPSVDLDMKVLIGGAEFGKNNEFIKALKNVLNDLQHGPGPSNDLIGKDGFARKKFEDIGKDLRRGPGSSNDLTGKNGAVRRILRF